MNCLARCTFDKVVNYRCDEEFAVNFFEVQDTFVGVNHIFEVGSFVGDKGEVVVAIIFVVKAANFAQFDGAVKVNDSHDASRETATHRNEVDVGFETVLQC